MTLTIAVKAAKLPNASIRTRRVFSDANKTLIAVPALGLNVVSVRTSAADIGQIALWVTSRRVALNVSMRQLSVGLTRQLTLIVVWSVCS